MMAYKGKKQKILTIKWIKKERKAYATHWSENNAQYFEEKGYYSWMSEFINGYEKVLEIGTGDGTGTLNLVRSDHKVVSIDENAESLELAEKNLRDAGVNVKYIRRGKMSLSGQSYTINYLSVDDEEMPEDVLLIEGDILNDPELIKWLCNIKPFDAVICWLIGSHPVRIFNQAIQNLNARTPGDYRLIVQNKVYELADEILRSKGVIHIVDRLKMNLDPQIREMIFKDHEDQASVTSLSVESINSVKYEDPYGSGGVPMGSAEGQFLPNDNSVDSYFVSVISRKP